jgi:hypothetical protein
VGGLLRSSDGLQGSRKGVDSKGMGSEDEGVMRRREREGEVGWSLGMARVVLRRVLDILVKLREQQRLL